MPQNHYRNPLFHNAASTVDHGAGESANLRLAPYISRALETLSDHGVEFEDHQRLTVIVEAALESRSHFFAAALDHPDQEELDLFFADFILRCVLPRRARCD